MINLGKKPKHKRDGKRWGKKFIDKRDWKKTNEDYIVRGEFLLDLNWVKSWDEELREMNASKRGHPYEFPESLIKLQAVWNQWVGLREVEGITRKLTEVAKLPDYNDYSTIGRRITKVKTDFDLIPLELALLNQEIRYCREFHDASSLDNSDWRDRIPGGNIHTQCEIDVMTGPLCGRHYSGYISEKEV